MEKIEKNNGGTEKKIGEKRTKFAIFLEKKVPKFCNFLGKKIPEFGGERSKKIQNLGEKGKKNWGEMEKKKI